MRILIAAAVTGLLAQYYTEGAGPGDAARGAAAWKAEHLDAATGERRSCTTCHDADPRKGGRHAKTGEAIDAMVGGDALSDAANVEKWFGRNCKWTYGRPCTPQEKADFLAFFTK
ncbi:MAG: DUF1924 domain-containing protein [Myxococcota bacterium]